MNIEKLIETILNAANSLDTKKDIELVYQVLNLSNDEYEERIIKLKGTGCKSICSAPLGKNQLFYKCFDCSKEPSHVYCQQCYQADKHRNHVVTFHYSTGGCCDCGDTLVLKRRSFCNRHSQIQIQILSPENTLGQSLADRYKCFIMVSFALLFERTQRIVDYTDKLMKQIQNAITTLGLENSQEFMNESMPEFLDKEISLKEGLKIYQLIFRILKFLTRDNNPWSYATSKFLQIPIDINIQQLIKLYHNHPNNQFEKFKLDKQQQVCQCTILNLFVKHNVFFSRFQQRDTCSISELFYELHVDENFKTYLCQQILIHYNHLYNPVQVFKLITTDKQEIKVKINTSNYSADSRLNEIFPILAQNKKINIIYCKNKLERASLFIYFYQFLGQLALCLLNLYRELRNNTQIYYLFDVFSNQLLQLPLCDQQTQQYCVQFDSMILQQFYDEVVIRLFEQMNQILSLEAETFRFTPILPKTPKFSLLQNTSLLIYTLTKIYPCQQTETSTFHFLRPKEQKKFNNAEVIQISILVAYRKLLSVVVDTWKNVYRQNKVGLQNIFRLLINYYLNNYITSFKLKHESILKNYLSNIVICDRNFITLLSYFLVDYNDSVEALEDLLEISNLNKERLKDIMLNLLKRTLLSYIVLQKNGNPNLYKGQGKIQREQLKFNEVSLEQVDVSYIQLYAFLFGAIGINDIVNNYREIAQFFNYKSDPSFLICRIAQSDYDLIQCVGDMFGNDLPEQFQKGLNKLFQTIFFAQSFYQENDLRNLLYKFSYNRNLDLQKIILSSCELNQDNEQIQLKRSLLPVQYEPIFASLVLELKDQISDKLQTQNDKQSELFGTALANELNQLSLHKSSLTYKRLAILKSIVEDADQQILKQIIEQLQTQQEQGLIKNIQQVLEDHSVYINLVFLCNKHFQGPYGTLKQYLGTITQICFQIVSDINLTQTSNNIYQIFAKQLDDTLCIDLFQSDAQRACRSQMKKAQYMQKFIHLGSNFNHQIVETPTLMATDNCSLCKLQFEKDEIQYRALLITFSNLHHHIQMIPQPKSQKQQIDLFQIVASCCQHKFHKECLQKNEQRYSLVESYYLRCPICLSPYNFPFVSPMYIKDANDSQLVENLEFFLQTLNDKRIQHYYTEFSFGEGLKTPKVFDEIFSQVLCNLVLQLLSDLTKFNSKNSHILLQDVMSLLRIIYEETQTTILEQLSENKNEILYDILNLIVNFKIKQNNLNTFTQELELLLFQNPNKSFIIEALTQNLINSDYLQELLPYDIHKLTANLKQNYIERFQINFKEFLLKYYLAPCHKKSCKFLPLHIIYEQEQYQYICLICFKKMCCHYCGKIQNKPTGNLSRHSLKKHNGKTLYVNLQTSQIIIMQVPFITIHNNPLFKNLIGELPCLGFHKSIYYERYKLNLKAIDQIIEILVRDKFVHKLFQNIKEIYRTTL